MRNSKPPKRPLGTTPAMERALRAQMAKSSVARKDDAIKEVNVLPARGLMALGRQAIASGLRGPVRPVNSKEIADMARRYAEKDKKVLEDIGKLTQRQQQMVRDELARQYKKVTPLDKLKTIAKKIDKKLDPANTGRTGAIGIGVDETTNPKTVQLQEVEIMKPKKYSKGGSLKPVPAAKKGLAKLPTEVRNKMGYMTGGGKLDMMYQSGGTIPKRANKYMDLSKMGMSHAERVQWEEANKNRQIQEEDLRTGKATGKNVMLKTYVKPKSMAQGGKLKKPGAPNPLNPTKDNNSYISNAVDMSPSTKKQMEALRQAMMYFTGVSPKNK